jgi:hypothetical protein
MQKHGAGGSEYRDIFVEVDLQRIGCTR